MSYDLMVFEVTKAPKTKKEFMDWYEKLTEWEEDHSYDDISVASPALQSWYQEMRKSFPVMNGPDRASEEEMDADEESGEYRISDYSIARDAIYVSFSWSQAEAAYQTMRTLANKHKVGFFDVSGKGGDIILPGDQIQYQLRTNAVEYQSDKISPSVFARHLKEFSPDVWDFMVLSPNEVVNGSTFIQVGAPKKITDFKMVVELGIENPDRLELYRYYTADQNEVLQMLTDYFEKQVVPDYSKWEDISDEMNG